MFFITWLCEWKSEEMVLEITGDNKWFNDPILKISVILAHSREYGACMHNLRSQVANKTRALVLHQHLVHWVITQAGRKDIWPHRWKPFRSPVSLPATYNYLQMAIGNRGLPVALWVILYASCISFAFIYPHKRMHRQNKIHGLTFVFWHFMNKEVLALWMYLLELASGKDQRLKWRVSQ